MSGQLVERARREKDNVGVLKIALSNLRSRFGRMPVLVFEGESDVGPYEAWISKLCPSLSYQPLIAGGKERLIAFRAQLGADQTGMFQGVFFLIDRDFNDLMGAPSGDDIFCTCAYSVENYLVSESVLESILVDEFKCAAELDSRERAKALFLQVRSSFLAAIREANRRLHHGAMLGLRGKGIREAISDYVVIQIDDVKVVDGLDLTLCIPLSREITDEEARALDEIFDQLDPPTRFRGKFLLKFFMKWLQQLAEEQKAPRLGIFESRRDVKFSCQQLTMRSLATRSDVPDGLQEFAQRILAYWQKSTLERAPISS